MRTKLFFLIIFLTGTLRADFGTVLPKIGEGFQSAGESIWNTGKEGFKNGFKNLRDGWMSLQNAFHEISTGGEAGRIRDAERAQHQHALSTERRESGEKLRVQADKYREEKIKHLTNILNDYEKIVSDVKNIETFQATLLKYLELEIQRRSQTNYFLNVAKDYIGRGQNQFTVFFEIMGTTTANQKRAVDDWKEQLVAIATIMELAETNQMLIGDYVQKALSTATQTDLDLLVSASTQSLLFARKVIKGIEVLSAQYKSELEVLKGGRS